MPDPSEISKILGSESEAESKQKRSESEAERLVSWAVRPSSDKPGMGEVRLTTHTGRVLHMFFEPMVAYDLSDKLLELAAELKTKA